MEKFERPWGKAPPLNRDAPSLIYSLKAWRQILRAGAQLDTEVAGYGIALDPANPLYIHEVALFRQKTKALYWEEADDLSVAHHLGAMTARGLTPDQSCRVLWHTHPNIAPIPSGTDLDVFEGLNKIAPWMVMAIVSTGKGNVPTKDNTLARLQLNPNPGSPLASLWMDIPVLVDTMGPLPPGTPYGPDGWESDVDNQIIANVVKAPSIYTSGGSESEFYKKLHRGGWRKTADSKWTYHPELDESDDDDDPDTSEDAFRDLPILRNSRSHRHREHPKRYDPDDATSGVSGLHGGTAPDYVTGFADEGDLSEDERSRMAFFGHDPLL